MKAYSLAPLAGALMLAGCEFMDEKGSDGPGKRVSASITWMSSSLSKSRSLAKPAAAPVGAPAPGDSVGGPGGPGNGPGGPVGGPGDPADDLYLSYRLNPVNMEGRLIQLALMVGQPGSGGGGSAIHLVRQGDNGFLERTVSNSEALSLFNLSERLSMGEDFLCCSSDYPSVEKAYSGWFEVMFAYADVTFRVDRGALAGDHTVRVAFADVEDKGYRKGDLLYKTTDGFRWLDSATSALSASRPAVPLRLGWVAGYNGSGDGRGNQHIPTLFIAIQDSQRVHMPADTVLANSWEFIADFILAGGLIFRRMDPAAMTSVAQLLAHFDIRADRDNASPGADGISSNFYAIKTPLEKPRPNDFKDSLDNWILPPPADSSH